MKKSSMTLLVVAACLCASQTVHAGRGLENCHVVRGTADARNREILTERALRRLHRHVELRRWPILSSAFSGPVRARATARSGRRCGRKSINHVHDSWLTSLLRSV